MSPVAPAIADGFYAAEPPGKAIKQTNIHIVGVPEEEKGSKRLTEVVMVENFPYMGRRHPGPGKRESQTR